MILRLICAAAVTAMAQNVPAVLSITICGTYGAGSGNCPANQLDTAEPVLAPIGGSLNTYGGLASLADQHTTIFPPGTIPNHSDYLFFAASRTNQNLESGGMVVLTGGSGPNANGQWTLDFAPDFGAKGQVFLSPVQHDNCPSVNSVAQQDQTFDLNYANPGSVVLDPTNPTNTGTGRVLMIYQGTNNCVGLTGGSNASNSLFSQIGVATSLDFGHTWPTYRSDWTQLPGQNPATGPQAPLGATGGAVCEGNDCMAAAPANYGRYAVVGPPLTIAGALAVGQTLTSPVGDTEPSAFIDDVSSNPAQYVYTVHHYVAGPANLENPPLATGDPPMAGELVVSRAKLNGGTAPLSFSKWSGHTGTFSVPGLGGTYETPVLNLFPGYGRYYTCQSSVQTRAMGSISFVDSTQQYLLLFVCFSPSDPATNSPSGGPGPGAAWFFSTISAAEYDLSHQEAWSGPTEIIGSWSEATRCDDGSLSGFNGNYPSIMSLNAKPGHIANTGFVFFMSGCPSGPTDPPRQFLSREFTITTNYNAPAISKVANAASEAAAISPNTWVEIKGSNLAPVGDSRTWQSSDFVNGQMPTALDGVRVTVNLESAYVYYISPTQINILTPPDAMSGNVSVQVSNNFGVSDPHSTPWQTESPSLFLFNGGPYVAATHADGSLLGPASLYPGSSTPARPGETIVMYANGFGATSTPVVRGASTQSGALSPLPVVTIGGIQAAVEFAGLIGPGEFQFNVVVPPAAPGGDNTLTVSYGGTSTQANVLITIQR